MSYDLQVWSTEPPPLPACLPDSAQWQAQNDVWTWARRGWQVVAGPVHVVDPDDVPDDVRAALPGISYMVEFNLEPLGAPQAAYALLKRVAKTVAMQSHGVVVDLQSDAVTTPAGVRRYVSGTRSATLTALQLSWFSVDARLASRAGLERVVDCFEQHVPEALPVRYGLYEPPCFRYSETGRQHLIDFLEEEYLVPGSLGSTVWRSRRPVVDVTLSIGVGARRPGDLWRSHRVTLTLDASVLEQSGWPTALQRLWRRMAHDVHAFYADVRLLQRYRRYSGTAEEWRAAERHPVCASFWTGIPRDGAMAVALGPPYLSRWPQFELAADREGEIGFISPPAWTGQADALVDVAPVPDRLAQQSTGYGDEGGPNLRPTYPSEWPFTEA